jgi:hypothetical protein
LLEVYVFGRYIFMIPIDINDQLYKRDPLVGPSGPCICDPEEIGKIKGMLDIQDIGQSPSQAKELDACKSFGPPVKGPGRCIGD